VSPESRRSICEANFSSKLLINGGERVRGFIGSTEELVGVSCSPNFICSVENVGRDCIGDLGFGHMGALGNDRGSMAWAMGSVP